MNKYYIAFIIAIVILIIYTQYNIHGGTYEDYISGFWVGDEGFCEEAGVGTMLLFIGAPERSFFSTKRTVYLIVGEDVSNQTAIVSYRNGSSGFARSIGPYALNTQWEYSNNEVFPLEVCMEFDMPRGMLRIFDDDTMHAIFYKRQDITDSVTE